MTRVLLLIKCLGPGGAEQLLVDTIANGDRSRFEYEVAYVLRDEDGLVDSLRQTGVRVHCLGARRNWDLSWLVALGRLLRSGRFDVVHSHLPYAAAPVPVVTRFLGRGRRPALVYTEHNLWQMTPLPVRGALRATIDRYDAILAVSGACAAALPDRSRRRAQVIVHGVNQKMTAALVARGSEVRGEVREELGLGDGEVLVLTVANLRPQKGYEVLLEAAHQVAARRAPVRFVSVGRGPLRDELQDLHRRLGLGDRFRFLGSRPDAVRLMAGSDIFVLSSHYEGLPVALMEAVSVGSAVVATSVGSVPDVVTDGDTGLLVGPGRPDDLADALVRLAGDVRLRRSLGAAALAASGQFDIAIAAERIEDVYERLLAGSTVGP